MGYIVSQVREKVKLFFLYCHPKVSVVRAIECPCKHHREGNGVHVKDGNSLDLALQFVGHGAYILTGSG